MNMKFILLLIVSLLICSFSADQAKKRSSHNERLEKFHELPRPEKWWAFFHPLILKRSYHIAKEAKRIADEKISDPDLDGDHDGGQVDAFRHTLWMAMMSREFGKWRSLSLGRAHEESNYQDYLARRLEDGNIPDHQACIMDLRNNSIGADLGRKYRKLSDSALIEVVKANVLEGKSWVLLKDRSGNFLDADGAVIPYDSLKGRWETKKQFVRSNKSRIE